MSPTFTDPSARPAPPPALIAAIRTAAFALVVLAIGLTVQLWRHDALLGGRVARTALDHDDLGWRGPHFVANATSTLGGTVVAPALLLALAAVLAKRVGHWRPLLGAAVAVPVLDVCLAVGKGLAGETSVSGPAATSVVCWATAYWLLRPHLRPALTRALHRLAAACTLAIGVSQLYLGHPAWALLVSWSVGGLVVVALVAVRDRVEPRAAPAPAD